MGKSPAGYVAFITGLTSILLFLPSFSCGGSNEPNSSSQQPKSFLDVNTILNTWESNYAHIDSMKISYAVRAEENCKPPASDPNMVLSKYSHYERIEQGARYHVRTIGSKTGLKDSEHLVEDSFDGTITKRYFELGHSGSISKGLINISSERNYIIRQYMRFDSQGIRDEYKDLYPNGIPSLSLDIRSGISNNNITISPTLEVVNGQLCHVIKKIAKEQPDKNYMIICLAHEKGMLPIKYQEYMNGALYEEYNIEEIASTKTEQGVFWYPKQAHRFLCDEHVGTINQKLTVDYFFPNIAVKDSDFTFDFPKGTWVVDDIQRITYTVGVEGSEHPLSSPPNQR